MEINLNDYQDNNYFVPDIKPKTQIEMPSPFILGRSLSETANADMNGEFGQNETKKLCMLNYNKVSIYKKIINKRKV
jgi:hypothetical protein